MGKEKTRGKRARDGFAQLFSVSLSLAYRILIIWSFELSKCSLKYEPSVFNINTNVKDGISAVDTFCANTDKLR